MHGLQLLYRLLSWQCGRARRQFLAAFVWPNDHRCSQAANDNTYSPGGA